MRKRVDGFEQEAALGEHAETGELEAVVPVGDPHVAAVGARERVEIALARHHGFVREVDEPHGLAPLHVAHGHRRAQQLAPQVRPLVVHRRRVRNATAARAQRAPLRRGLPGAGATRMGRSSSL